MPLTEAETRGRVGGVRLTPIDKDEGPNHPHAGARTLCLPGSPRAWSWFSEIRSTSQGAPPGTHLDEILGTIIRSSLANRKHTL